MRLTSRDGAAGVLGILGVLVYLAVVNAWGWPLLGSYGAGSAALGIIGFAMCVAGGRLQASFGHPDLATVACSALGAAALGLAVAGTIAGTKVLFTWLAAVLFTVWVFTTLVHASAPRPSTRPV